MTTLYKKSGGSINVWSVEEDFCGFVTRWGKEGGRLQEHFEEVLDGKQGRTVDEQIEHRMQSKINGKIDAGYVYDRTVALTKRVTNAMGLLRPMLAQRLDRVTTVRWDNCVIQNKYDGHRCLIKNMSGNLMAYSRNGKPIDTIDHILKDIHIPDGATLDGELYVHGLPLQKISSLVKRKQFDSSKLQYIVYDTIANATYRDRYKLLQEWILPNYYGLQIAPTTIDPDEDKIMDYLHFAISTGYEGLIIRQDTAPYQDGKRAPQLIKVKKFLDEEFTVISILESKDGWAILRCFLKNGQEFGVSAPGTHAEKREVLLNKEQYIGRQVKVEFAGYTILGKPFHPIATMWRNALEE